MYCFHHVCLFVCLSVVCLSVCLSVRHTLCPGSVSFVCASNHFKSFLWDATNLPPPFGSKNHVMAPSGGPDRHFFWPFFTWCVCPAKNTHFRALVWLEIIFKLALGVFCHTSTTQCFHHVCLSVCVCIFVQISVRAVWASNQLQIISKHFFGMLLTFSTNFHPYTMWLLPLVARTDTFLAFSALGVCPAKNTYFRALVWLEIIFKLALGVFCHTSTTHCFHHVCLSVCVCIFVQITVRAVWALNQLQIISKHFFGMLLTFSTNFHPYTMWLLPLVARTDTFLAFSALGVCPAKNTYFRALVWLEIILKLAMEVFWNTSTTHCFPHVCLSVCVCKSVNISVWALWALNQLQIFSKLFFVCF